MTAGVPSRDDTVGESMMADAIIRWPDLDSLANSIESLQALNPQLGLQCVTIRFESCVTGADPHVEHDDDRVEYLLYEGTSLDVLEIVLPEPAEDDFMVGLTRCNRDWRPVQTPIGSFRIGPRRIERNAAGNLFIRPRSWHVACEANGFAMAYQGDEPDDYPFDQIGRIQSRWGIFRSPDLGEFWEVEYTYLPAGHFYRADGKHKNDREWWSTPLIAAISYVDEHDLPLETHIDRAYAIVTAGAQVVIIADLSGLVYRVYRPNGMRTERDGFVLPEMPWFAMPKIQPQEDA